MGLKTFPTSSLNSLQNPNQIPQKRQTAQRINSIPDWPWLILGLLALFSGFCSAWLGIGGSVFIVPLLPFLSGLDSLASLQVSLVLIFSISFLNSLSFIFQKLVLWDWFFRGAGFGLFFAFFSGFLVTYFSHLQIRFVLWLFLFVILSLPLLLKRVSFLRQKGFYIFSSLMGVCSGGTGLGGGMILSPYLYESGKIPAKNIPGLVSCIMFFVSLFSLSGQISRIGFSFMADPLWRFCFFVLFIPSVFGLSFGYIANIRQKNLLYRRWALRIMAFLMFIKLSWELVEALF